jgi:ribosome-binding factor A
MKNYTINTYADGFGVWHSEIVFLPPLGNTGEAERVAANAMRNAKRRIRQAIAERMNPKRVRRLAYRVSANSFVPGAGQLATLTITEN